MVTVPKAFVQREVSTIRVEVAGTVSGVVGSRFLIRFSAVAFVRPATIKTLP